MTAWQVLITEPIDPAGIEVIGDRAEITWGDAYADRDALLGDLDRYDAIVVRTFEIDARVIDRATNLNVISKHGTGVDNIDVEAATERAIPVCRVPGTNTREVAEHALAMLLALWKRLRRADADLRDGVWDRQAYESRTVAGTCVGLFGCGGVGIEMAELLGPFDVETIGYDPYIEPASLPANLELVETSRALFDRADAVSVHAPLTDETAGAIGREELDLLGPTGLIVNTARGGIIDESALIEALDRGTIDAAGLDVFASEPPDPTHPLLRHERVILTPHIAGVTVEAMRRLSTGALTNVRTVLEGGLPEHTINADAFPV